MAHAPMIFDALYASRVVRTITELERSDTIRPMRLNEAINYRILGRQLSTQEGYVPAGCRYGIIQQGSAAYET